MTISHNIVTFIFFMSNLFVWFLASGVKGLYQIYAKSLYLSDFETYIESFSPQNASFNRKQNITLLVLVSGTEG